MISKKNTPHCCEEESINGHSGSSPRTQQDTSEIVLKWKLAAGTHFGLQWSYKKNTYRHNGSRSSHRVAIVRAALHEMGNAARVSLAAITVFKGMLGKIAINVRWNRGSMSPSLRESLSDNDHLMGGIIKGIIVIIIAIC